MISNSEEFTDKFYGREVDCSLTKWGVDKFTHCSLKMTLTLDGHEFYVIHNGELDEMEVLIDSCRENLYKKISYYSEDRFIEYERELFEKCLKQKEDKHNMAKWLIKMTKG